MSQENRRFYAVPDDSRIPKEHKDFVMSETSKLEHTLQNLFPRPCRYGTCNVGEYSGLTVIDRLIDTEETRIGAPPEGAAKQALQKEANIAIEKGSPLVLVGIYGTPRHLDHPELNKAQLADMSAVMMVQAALDRVHSAHEPGAQFRMIDEDLTALWLDIAQHPAGQTGKPRFKTVYEQYYADRQRLLRTLEKEGLINTGKTRIELLSESDLYESVWERSGFSALPPEEDFLEKCEKNRPEFLCYLFSSGRIIAKYYGEDDKGWVSSAENVELWEKCQREILDTPECAAIKKIGWQALIPPEMRKFFLEKFRTILGDANLKADDEKLLFHIVTYLSSTLAKHNSKTLTEGIPVGSPIIRVPLVKPLDGRPPSHQSLVAQRTLPKVKGGIGKKISTTNRAAWLSMAVQGGDKLRLVDTSSFVDTPQELVVPVQIYTVGSDNGQGSYLVDTAILLSNRETKD
ncbi:MAG: hypothetical protein WCT11_04510 [Candidatus Magasanikbacteria bacterium]